MPFEQLGAAAPIAQGAQKAINPQSYLDTVLHAIKTMLGMGDAQPAAGSHDAAVQQMNADQNAHANDAANQSFQPPAVLPRRAPKGKQ